MATPPNPFDQAGVDKYLAEQAEKQAAKENPRRVELPEPGTKWPPPEEPSTDPAVEAQTMLDHWASRGPEVYSAALEAIADSVDETTAGLREAGTDDEMAPAVVTAAKLGKRLRDTGAGLYQASRVSLWEWVGRHVGDHKLEDGQRFKFTSAPRVTRSTDLKKLQAQFPEAYRATVKERPTDPDAPGKFTV